MYQLQRFIGPVTFALIGCWACTGQAFGAEPSGITIAAIPSASAAGGTGTRVLHADGPVFMGDRVQTGSAGEVQIQFRDETKMVVGPNSSLLIDAFVYDPGSHTATQVTMRAVKGAFRFITGASRKQAYSIKTPTVTMGIRGTKFDFSILPSGETVFALYEGEARLCDRSNHCVEVKGRCAVAMSPPKSQVSQVDSFERRRALLQASMPFAVSQAGLHPDFRVDTSSCGLSYASIAPDLSISAPPSFSASVAPSEPSIDPSPSGPGNPGNGKGVGNAGENPGGGNFGNDGVNGRSDVASGNGNNGNHGNK